MEPGILRRLSSAHPIVQLPFNGGFVSAREVDFTPRQEPWAKYDLEDGGMLRIRTTALKVFAVLEPHPDNPGEYRQCVNEQNEPLHIVTTAELQVVFSQ